MDFSDKEDPLIIYPTEEFFPINIYMSQEIIFYGSNSVVINDDQDFSDAHTQVKFDEFTIKNTLNHIRNPVLTCSKADLEAEKCECFIKLSYNSGNRLTKYLRTYPKLWETFSEVGGFIEILFLFFSVLSLAYSRFMINLHFRKNQVGIPIWAVENLVRKWMFVDSSPYKLLSSIANSNLDAVSLFRKKQLVTIINNILLSEEQEVLAPLLLINTNKNTNTYDHRKETKSRRKWNESVKNALEKCKSEDYRDTTELGAKIN